MLLCSICRADVRWWDFSITERSPIFRSSRRQETPEGNHFRRPVAYEGLIRNLKGDIMFDTLSRSFSSWRKYRQTYDELSRLSNRELNDLGIARADISRIARGEKVSTF